MIETLSTAGSLEVLRNNYIGSLAFVAGQTPYVIPITYFFNEKENALLSYSMEGHKIVAMRKNPIVSVGITQIEDLAHWKSVLVHGSFDEMHQIDAKYHLKVFADGLKAILKRKDHYDARFIKEFSSEMYDGRNPIVYRIAISEIEGRYRES